MGSSIDKSTNPQSSVAVKGTNFARFLARDWVLIADFDNLTGRAGLDVALRVALERELSLSRYVNCVPTGRVVDTLRLMKLDPASSRLTAGVARELCLRDGGIRAFIAGSIQQAGHNYQIALKLIEPLSGATAKIFVEDTVSEEEIFTALRRLAQQLRRALGESIDSIARSQPGLEKVTTPSLAALEAYSRGQRLYESAEFTKAGTLFDRAIALDRDFAAAYWSRACNTSVLGGDPRADFETAAALSDTVTERERLQILATHAFFIQRDMLKALQLCEILVREFPDDFNGLFLGSYLRLACGDWAGWMEHVEGLQRSRPNDASSHFWKGVVLLFVGGDSEGAYREARRTLQINPRFPAGFPHFAAPCRDWMRGILAAAREGYMRLLTRDMAKLGPLFQIGLRRYISRFFFSINDVDLALRPLETSEWMMPRPADSRIAQAFLLEKALIYEELGNSDLCRKFLRGRADSSSGISRITALGWLGIHAAKSGNSREAEHAMRELLNEQGEVRAGFFTPPLPGERERAQEAFSAQILGEIAVSKGKIAEEIQYFRKVLELVSPRGSVFSTVLSPRLFLVANESLAKACEQREEYEKSIEAYRAIIDHRSLLVTTPASGRIWLRAVRSIIPLPEEHGRPEDAEKYRGLLPTPG